MAVSTLSCLGCERVMVTSNVLESNTHYVGSATTSTETQEAAVFCTSCWDAMEDWFFNKNIDEAVMNLISACSGTGYGTTSAATHRISPVTELAMFYSGASAGITGR